MPFPLVLPIRLLPTQSPALFAPSPPRLQLRPALATTDLDPLGQIRRVDACILVKELLVVIARQPELVVNRSQYGLLKILAPLALDNQARPVIVEELIVSSAHTTIYKPIGTLTLYESN
jgi:hypothetical protein